MHLLHSRSGCEDSVSKAVPLQVNGDTLECMDKFCYLGDMSGSGVALKRQIG